MALTSILAFTLKVAGFHFKVMIGEGYVITGHGATGILGAFT